MKYNPETEFAEILRRSKTLQVQKERRKIQTIGISCSTLFALAILAVGMLRGEGGQLEGTRTTFGSFLLPTDAGGYVIAAVAAFAVGVLVTAICIRKRNKATSAEAEEQEPKEAERP
ncbi:MAG: hypothetical protein IJK06_00340 [Clostridia bacterium]|nr:hypothetical protein [Clostridia bacterium]